MITTTTTAARASADCEPVANADAVVAAGARLFVGELHGTAESPRAFGALVCHATKKHVPVRVGLELPVAEGPALAAFLASPGGPGDRAALVAGAFWHRELQDGRSSRAMVQLIESIRALKRAGADVDIVPFDVPEARDRDRAMAEHILAAIARAPKASWLLYAGNLHARKAGHARLGTTFTAMQLVAAGVRLTTLDARIAAGSAWLCFSATPSECGPYLVGRGAPRPLGVTLERTADGAYDGVLDVGAASFSPPAAVPMLAQQQARARSLDRQRQARAAYDAKDWARCGELYDALAQELRGADHAYDAACCHALAGKNDLAFAALSSAIELGFKDGDNLAKDTDLAPLRKDARWKPLVARIAAPPSAK